MVAETSVNAVTFGYAASHRAPVSAPRACVAPPSRSCKTASMRDLAALPKAHLHLHFTGSMKPESVAELADQYNVRLPGAVLETEDAVMLPPTSRGWFRFQRLYDAARACVRGEADMRRVVDEAAAGDAAVGSGRMEIQVDPTSYAPFVGGITPALEIILDEAKSASARHGISVGVIVAASRMRHPLEARVLARLAAKYAGDADGEVVGFGLSNDERQGRTSEFAPAFAIAQRAGLISVPHGGELLGADHVEVVLDNLAPQRLGHGVRALEDPRLVDRLLEADVALEVNPASNVSLGVFEDITKVPLAELYDTGLKIALGSDDPLLFKSRLNEQYEIARNVHGFSDDQLARLALDSIAASTAREETKKTMRSGVAAWLSDDSAGNPDGK